ALRVVIFNIGRAGQDTKIKAPITNINISINIDI
ncbi:unnamed protein product, partial [Mycena citricolor]